MATLHSSFLLLNRRFCIPTKDLSLHLITWALTCSTINFVVKLQFFHHGDNCRLFVCYIILVENSNQISIRKSQLLNNIDGFAWNAFDIKFTVVNSIEDVLFKLFEN
ncbi:unnamed protein product [Oikopleura dioica]|uniref:Uncharacterized protein n=1 Tax=Oikopleura dioica TaxID=34765 RepID=E4XV31_OIKDI|nr:unnamed protein product [Oikopleura dioica]